MKTSIKAVSVVVVVVVALGCLPAAALTPVADFGDNPGALVMLEHVPTPLPASNAAPMPVVLVLHGCNQDSDYAADTGLTALADEFGVLLVVAEQRLANNSQGCFNWFEDGDIDTGEGEAASLANMVRSALDRHAATGPGVDVDRVFVTGLSSGGAMTAVLLAVEPELFSAGASFAGIAYRCGVGVVSAFGCQTAAPDRDQATWAALVTDHVDFAGPWPRLLIVQGENDGTVSFDNSEALALQWTGLHGLPAAPTSTTTDGPRTTRRWTSASGGGAGDTVVVEAVAIADMGHGTPIDPPSCGSSAPFLVDEDFCGSRAAFDFFGLTTAVPTEGEGEGDAGEGEGEEGEGEGAEGEGEVGEGEGDDDGGEGAEGEGEALYPGDSCACSGAGDHAGVGVHVGVGAALLLLAQRRRKRTISSVVRSPG